MINFNTWDKINQYELNEGQKVNKPRVKLIKKNEFYEFL